MAKEDLTKIEFTPEDYMKAAETYKEDLLMVPVLSCMETLKYMNPIPGVHGKLHVGSASAKAQFAPFDAYRIEKEKVSVIYRTLETFLGNVQQEFVPNDYIYTLLGKAAAFMGDGQKQAPSAKLVLAAVAKALGESLHDCLFTAKRNDAGTTTAELFNGWKTIAEAEIAAGKIADSKGNYIEIDAFDGTNADQIAKEVERSCHPVLRRTEKFLYCSPEFADAYNDAYLVSHPSVPYNKQYEQAYVEGSNNKTTLVPLSCLAGSDMFFVSNKNNMLFGYDNISDDTKLEVLRLKSAFALTFAGAMFFGTEFYSIDERMLKVVKVKS